MKDKKSLHERQKDIAIPLFPPSGITKLFPFQFSEVSALNHHQNAGNILTSPTSLLKESHQ